MLPDLRLSATCVKAGKIERDQQASSFRRHAQLSIQELSSPTSKFFTTLHYVKSLLTG